MPTRSHSVKRLLGAAAMVGALGLGAIVAFPGVGLAQTEDTTTTVVEESSEPTTDTTVTEGPDSTLSEEGTKSQADRPQRGDGSCDHGEEISPDDA